MMGRDKLFQLRSKVKAGDLLDRDQLLSLIDHGIAALVEMAGGKSIDEARADLRNREREVGKALAQIRSELAEFRLFMREPELEGVHMDRIIYTTDAAIGMLNATKGPTWLREWNFYQPRIEEEFE